MTKEEYKLLLKLAVENDVPLNPMFVQHVEDCSLSTKECDFCQHGERDFMKRYLEAFERGVEEPLPLRARLGLWYLDTRYAVLWRLWNWGLVSKLPKWSNRH